MFTSPIKFLWLLIFPILAFTPQIPHPGDSAKKSKMIKWAVHKSSTIGIQGSTNVSDFECDVSGYYPSDTIFCSDENSPGKAVTLHGALQVDIIKFDCHNKMLTGDLRKTLKATEYPKLTIRFISLERAPLIQYNKDILKGWVEVELAGCRQKFEICYSFLKCGTSMVRLNGKRSFGFSDFKLTPPKKFMGMVKVKDKFNVDFNLLLTTVE